MKKVLLATTLFIGSMIYTSADAQVRINFSLNAARQPAWVPSGYSNAQYYYLPDIDVYYDVRARRYVYEDAGRWAFASAPPARYRDYNFNSGCKVVINDSRPYLQNEMYRNKYARYRNSRNNRVVMANSRDNRYTVADRDYNRHDRDRHDDDCR